MEIWDNIAEIVVKAQNGDKEAIGELYNKCSDYLYRRARYMLRTDEDAQDVTQEVFVDVIKTLNKLQEPKAFVGWLNKILLFKCYRYYDKSEYKVKNVNIDDYIETETDFVDDNEGNVPLPSLETVETKEALQRIIDNLPKEQKDSVIMYYFYQLKVDEIAEIMGCSSGTVKSRLNYGRKEMKKQIEDKRRKGIIFPAVVPFPIIAYLVHEELEKVVMPEHIVSEMAVKCLEAVKGSAGSQVTAGAVVKPSMSMLTKALIGVGVAAAVTVGAVLIFTQNNKEPVVPVATVTGVVENQVEGETQEQATEETPVQPAQPVTDSDYAKIYYEYVQNTLKPKGDFVDAEMADMTGDGNPELVALWYSEGDEQPHKISLYDYRNGSVRRVRDSQYEIVNSGNFSLAYLSKLDDKIYFVTAWESYSNRSVYQISAYEYVTFSSMSVSHNPENNSYHINGNESEASEASDILNQLKVPYSTWGVNDIGEVGYEFENTYGERLKQYITEE